MSARGRLALLVRSFPKLSETFILEEVLGLERAGFELTIFTLRAPSDALVQPAVSRVRAEVVALAGEGVAPDDDESLARALAAQLARRGLAHLHAHFIDRPAAIAARAARLAGATFSISAHAKDIYLGDPAEIRRRLGEARFTVTCTAYNRDVLQRLAPPGAAVHLAYHGIDVARFAPPAAPLAAAAAPPRILAVGRLREKKGFATLVAACALLRDRGIACECDIVGYGEQRAALEAAIDAAGLGSRVRLRGTMNHAQIIELYRTATVFAAPSEIAADGDRDGIPNVLLEAMACGLPVVSTPVSGIPEVVRDGVEGRLVPPADPRALADALGTLVGDAALRARLGAAARSTVVSRFGEDRNLARLATLLEPWLGADPARARPVRGGAHAIAALGATRAAVTP